MSFREKLIKLILRGDPTNFHSVCNELEESDLDISGATFKSLRLSGFDFSGFNLEASEWEACDFNNVRFDRANLSNSYLHSCSFVDVFAEETNFEGAALENSLVKRTLLKDCILTSAEFSDNQHSECEIIGGTWEEVDWSSLTFEGGRWGGISDVQGSMRLITLRGVSLEKVDFSGAEVSKCYHQGCELTEAILPEGFKARKVRRRTV
jgi:uncharacterized protein YjbI with pentapeptide repeats